VVLQILDVDMRRHAAWISTPITGSTAAPGRRPHRRRRCRSAAMGSPCA
jgi:hypothetical protein